MERSFVERARQNDAADAAGRAPFFAMLSTMTRRLGSALTIRSVNNILLGVMRSPVQRHLRLHTSVFPLLRLRDRTLSGL